MIQKLKFCIDSNPIFPYKKIQQRNEKYHDPVDKSKNAFTEAKTPLPKQRRFLKTD